MSRLLREPLVHFLLGGALLFGLYGLVRDDSDTSPDRIVVSESSVAALAAGFERTWMRPPTRAELDGLVDDFVTEEILYREALALGLDRDDVVVRRRMRQKMEWVNEGLSEEVPPGDEELQAYLARDPERFRIAPRTRFEQIFFDPDREGASADARAAALLGRLRDESADRAETSGDATLLPGRLDSATPSEIDATFGAGFSAALEQAAAGDWTGPLRSSFGLHLVRVERREPGRLPTLGEVRADVERELVAERRIASRERFERELRERYEVEIQMPADDAVAASEP